RRARHPAAHHLSGALERRVRRRRRRMSEVRAAHPILPPGQTYADVTDQLAGIPLHLPSRRIWLIALLISSALLGLLFVSATVLFATGVGIWGLNIPATLSLD